MSHTETFISNFYKIAKIKKIKLGQIEIMMGKKKGYTSRLKGGQSSLNLEDSIKISEILRENLADMITENYYKQVEARSLEFEILELNTKIAALKGQINE